MGFHSQSLVHFSQIWPYGSPTHNFCTNHARIGDGRCDFENDARACNYDGGDCCPNKAKIDDGICDEENKNKVCDFDWFDCCQNRHLVNDWVCNPENNNEYCDFDGGDCCNHADVGDGICQDNNNIYYCNYDGGDCCLEELIINCVDCQCHEDELLINKVKKNFSKMLN